MEVFAPGVPVSGYVGFTGDLVEVVRHAGEFADKVKHFRGDTLPNIAIGENLTGTFAEGFLWSYREIKNSLPLYLIRGGDYDTQVRVICWKSE